MSDQLGAIRALLNAGLGLAEKTSSGRMALARVAAVVHPEALPSAMREEAVATLAAWRQEPEPLSAGEVEKLLKGVWKDKPSKVLDDLDPEPVAVTVTSQVHRGRHDGADVAVKLLRPGLAELVRADLKAASALAGPLRGALPQSDPGALIREASERALDELDLEHEGATQRALGRALRGVDGVTVPRPITELTHHEVLVREWAEGTTLADGAQVADADEAARRLVVALTAAARAGTLHADPEPGNIVVAPDGTLALIDAAASTRVASERVDHAADALAALHADDAAGLGAALARLGWLTDDGHATAVLSLGREIGGPFLAGPQALHHAALGERADVGLDLAPEIAPLAAHVRVPPQDLWALRGIATLGATLATLGATHDWPALVLEALRG